MSSAFEFIQILVILLIHLQYLDSSFVSNIVPYLVSCLGAEPLDEVPHLLLRDVGVLDQLNINMKHFYLTVKPGLWIRIRMDPHSFPLQYADPDPAVFLNADLNPNPDPDPGPGPGPGPT